MSETDPDSGWYSEDAATFGDRLAAAREDAGLTQRELAVRLGVKPSVITGWEEDRKEPRANRLTMLSGMLGISLQWLMTGKGEGPDGGEDVAITPEVGEILTQMRVVRSQMTQAAETLARLEKQLRKALQDQA